ncbi:MAG: mandelate racemase [Acidobacteriota bacterium]
MQPPQLQVLSVRCVSERCDLRLPFQFGMVTLEQVSLCTVEVEMTCDGHVVQGYSSDLLVPKWFEKNADLSLQQDADKLRRAIEGSAAQSATLEPGSAFALWRELFAARVERVPEGERLVQGLGVSLIERALLDGLSRATQAPFVQALSPATSGYDGGALHAELAGTRGLEPAVPQAMRVRHTVGLADALATPLAQPDDGQPTCLRDDVRAFGLELFKLKVGGKIAADVERLAEIADVLENETSDYRVTLDGNEQYGSVEDLRELLARLEENARTRRLAANILYIEQPLARARSYEPDRLIGIERLDAYGGLILDEADCDLDSFERALRLGYRGVSVKNCKGVFRALANSGLCAVKAGRFQSSEDLTNVPILPLQQDLATAAALGLTHSERNGHHYFLGLDHVPESEVEGALAAHPDLYEAGGGAAALRIEGGAIALGSILAKGYGTHLVPDITARAASPRCDWTWHVERS